MPQQPAPEFSRLVSVEDLEPGGEISRKIEADEAERAALAKRMDLVRLDMLSADITLRRVSGKGLIRASGRLLADVVQNCVATMAPVPGHIEEDIDELFAPEGYEAPEEQDVDDLPESFDGREIDIGELAAQLMCLALDPYPRASEAAIEILVAGEPDDTERRRPFEGLAEMLKKRN